VKVDALHVESFQCRNHPEREGVGICIICRRVFCVECSTKIDGVNHCRECLAKKQEAARATATRSRGVLSRAFEGLVASAAVAGSFCLVVILLVAIGESHAQGGSRRLSNDERLQTIARALRSYKRDVGSFPAQGEGLEALVERPDGVTGWRGPYLDKTPVVDAFAQQVLYRAPTATEKACVIGSSGFDRHFETDFPTVGRSKTVPGHGTALGDDVILFVD